MFKEDRLMDFGALCDNGSQNRGVPRESCRNFPGAQSGIQHLPVDRNVLSSLRCVHRPNGIPVQFRSSVR
jgi:hypothetical protein